MFLFFKFPYGPLKTNALLLGCPDTKKAAVFDPAAGSTGAILAKAEKLGLQIENIFLTHSHWDHIADCAELKAKTGASIHVHELDEGNLIQPGSDGIPLFLEVRAAIPDFFLKEEIQVGKIHFQVIHTPGHSPGSVCFYSEAKRLLISGDTLFQATIGSLNLPTARPELMWISLEKLAKLPPVTKVIPGHGADTTIGEEADLLRRKPRWHS